MAGATGVRTMTGSVGAGDSDVIGTAGSEGGVDVVIDEAGSGVGVGADGEAEAAAG